MGIVFHQSLRNTLTTYLGFALGAISALFLFTRFMSAEYYGLVSYILSTATIMMPLMAFGVQNTMVKFYSNFRTKNSVNSFLTLMLLLPLAISIPIGLLGALAYDSIAELLSRRNPIVADYVWYIYVTALSMAYFEVFYAWVKIQMLTVFGNFMKEVFHRVGTMLLLFALFLNWISIEEFLIGMVITFMLRALVMMVYAFSVRLPVFRFERLENRSAILKYALLIIVAGSIATMILDIDKFMLNNYIDISKIAYYSVAVYVATVIAVPQRAMHQILHPLTAQFLSQKDKPALRDLYQRSSLTLFVVSGLVFLLIILNIKELYGVLPVEYSDGLFVVLLISLAKLYDNLLGNNNAILFNSDYYRMVLLFGVILAVLAIVLNMLLIPRLGMYGAAIATFMSISVYNSIKIIFVRRKFNMLPFSKATLKVSLLIVVLALAFYFWDFPIDNFYVAKIPLHHLINIVLKSIIIVMVYLWLVFKLKLSEDINDQVGRWINRG